MHLHAAKLLVLVHFVKFTSQLTINMRRKKYVMLYFIGVMLIEHEDYESSKVSLGLKLSEDIICTRLENVAVCFSLVLFILYKIKTTQ